MEYLDFELPIKELEEQLDKCEIIGKESGVDETEICKKIEKKLLNTKKEIYKSFDKRVLLLLSLPYLFKEPCT